MERSEGKSPAAAQRRQDLPESERKRPNALAALQRDNSEARRSGQRGSLERSEGKSPAAAKRGRVLPESEGKRPSALTASQRDNSEEKGPSARRRGPFSRMQPLVAPGIFRESRYINGLCHVQATLTFSFPLFFPFTGSKRLL